MTEVRFAYSRSSGKGGQNVNKVSTKAELSFHVESSECLNDEQKQRITEKLALRINEKGYLKLQSSEARSQSGNKEIVTNKFKSLIQKALHVRRKRIPTAQPEQAKEKRLSQKRKTALLKKLRKKETGH
ncbi:MAG: aminoacyl-tRNA hydrolase [Bacteroidetes bacterium]|nr:aminoacyl-tRNA hydrolase [Bacteroidota bacterium]